jgi:hypothetical protein
MDSGLSLREPRNDSGENPFIKICREFETLNQLLRQKLGTLKPDFYDELRTLLSNKGRRVFQCPFPNILPTSGRRCS